MKRLLLIFLVLLAACHFNQRFDKLKWNTFDSMFYPYRDAMLDDLLKHHSLKGLTYKELTTQIGEPVRSRDDKDNPYYQIVTDYGSDIDPVYTKILTIHLSKDSIVTGYKVEEWKKE